MDDEDENGFSRRGISPGKGVSFGGARAKGRLGRDDAEGEFGIEWVAEAQELESLATRGGCQQEIEF